MSRRGSAIPLDRKRIHDLTPLVSARLAVFPGDHPFRREVSLDMAKGDSYGLSSIHSTVHIGAHTDAPVHYHAKGVGIDARPLERYYGKCQVISVNLERGERIRPEHLDLEAIQAPRVLVRTGSFPDPEKWNADFNSFSVEAIEALAGIGVVLVGIDTPSIDLAEDAGLESHGAVYRHDLAILEGIVLGGVKDGVYILSALPLKLEGADASPVRAVLIEEESI